MVDGCNARFHPQLAKPSQGITYVLACLLHNMLNRLETQWCMC